MSANLPPLVFATNNANKLAEVQAMLANEYRIVTLSDIGFYDDIPEPYPTFRGNAWTKAQTVFEQTGYDCFAEDTGLVVDALQGEPGVLSARYAGEPSNARNNIELVLQRMQDITHRQARFVTVIALLQKGEIHYFEGTVEGTIRHEASGEGGFGYDPIFQPNGYTITFSEMPKSEKNRISHRAKAVAQLVDFLKKTTAE
ncbi:MAG: RdgB/HAM1 family non-canonical purine NTP pyrophosphatase [Chitinophagales bacterium]|nr:RdgB/HAM1 family non-canonical purine NTP pyrophosphatase [Chitinophagales bacterium]HNI44732.1 RdgB/HAM1 family non-canonical purine NTP pyrophosphatase [Chitinophagales bacterium]HNL07768.1 RdgB/HAM1 family non-canonical purine NTP pyrophosphatase [Chitinophagales bacterium]